MKYLVINKDLDIELLTLAEINKDKYDFIERIARNEVRVIEVSLSRELVGTDDGREFTTKNFIG